MDVRAARAFILQKELTDFETELAKFTGSKHAIGMADGTNSLMVALIAASIGRGFEDKISSLHFE